MAGHYTAGSRRYYYDYGLRARSAGGMKPPNAAASARVGGQTASAAVAAVPIYALFSSGMASPRAAVGAYDVRSAAHSMKGLRVHRVVRIENRQLFKDYDRECSKIAQHLADHRPEWLYVRESIASAHNACTCMAASTSFRTSAALSLAWFASGADTTGRRDNTRSVVRHCRARLR